MVLRKSLRYLPGNIAVNESWKNYKPGELILLKKNESSKDNKGLVKLILGVVYFLSLVSALAVLMF